MRRLALFCALVFGFVATSPATGKAFFRIASLPLPPAEKTGIRNLVLTWPLRDASVVAQLRSRKYQVWLQCEAKDFSPAAKTADRAKAEGVVVSNADPAISEKIHSYMAAHKNLSFRILIP